MKISKTYLGIFLFCFSLSILAQQRSLPTPEQIKWAQSEIGVIIHLDINIFAPETFDYKKPETLPKLDAFNPTDLNTDQWIRTAKAAGAKYAILTAKHGTGFCLWPSAVNPYNVGHTKWRNGQFDILKSFIASCKKYGLKPGFYYNTNMNTYYNIGFTSTENKEIRKKYNQAVLAQLTELWSNYGKLFEIWFDGGVMADSANGIETGVLKLIKEKQPQAILFQGPVSCRNIIRWVGNEDGIASYPQWSRIDANTSSLGIEKIEGLGGDMHGKYWCPAESDFPIRRNNAWNGGWIWKEGEDSLLFSENELIDKYYKSVGRNTNMLIGMVVDNRGLIPRADSLLFSSFGKRLSQLFLKPIVEIRNSHKATIEFELNHAQTLDQVILKEDISKGENIYAYTIEAWIDNAWKNIAHGQSIGHKRIQVFDHPVTTNKLRFRVNKFERSINIKKITFY